jgi:hypothetical protein
VKRTKSNIIYIKRIILIQRRTKLSRKYILTKNRKDRSEINKTKAKDKTNK